MENEKELIKGEIEEIEEALDEGVCAHCGSSYICHNCGECLQCYWTEDDAEERLQELKEELEELK